MKPNYYGMKLIHGPSLSVALFRRLFDWLLHRLIDQIFNQVDYNNNGRLEAVETEVAILKIYNIINRRKCTQPHLVHLCRVLAMLKWTGSHTVPWQPL